MNDKCLNMLGICKKAGYLIAGTQKVKEAIIKKKAVLVVAACDISEKTIKELNFILKNKQVLILNYNRLTLAHATGTTAGIFAITSSSFAEQIIKLKEI